MNAIDPTEIARGRVILQTLAAQGCAFPFRYKVGDLPPFSQPDVFALAALRDDAARRFALSDPESDAAAVAQAEDRRAQWALIASGT